MAAPVPYQVLARKYRPQAFGEVVGQSGVVSTLENAITQGRLHHAYLFSGTRGVGKTTLARLYARALNCVKGPTTQPCSSCDPCREIASGSSMDVIEIDGASNRKVEDVDPLREAARYAPARDRHKIFIIDEVHMLSETAFNALLKTLEEPPPRIVFLFATTEPEEVPDTIMSRCLHLACRRIAKNEIASALQRTAKAEGIEGSAEAFDLIAGLAAGSMRDGLSLLDQVLAYSEGRVTEEEVRSALGLIDRHLVSEFIEAIGRKEPPGVLAVIERLSDAGADLPHFSREVLSRVRDMMILKTAGKDTVESVGLSKDETADCETAAEMFSPDGLLRLVHAMLDLVDRIRRDEHPRFLLEAWALRMIRLADLTPIEELLRRLETAGGTLPGPGGAATGSSPEPDGPGGSNQGALRFTAVTPYGRAPESAASPPLDRTAGASGEGESEGPARGQQVSHIIERIAQHKVSLATFLQQAKSIRVDGSTVVVTVLEKQGFLKTALESNENRATVSEAATAVLGRPAEVRVDIQAPPSDDLARLAQDTAKEPGNQRERLINEAMKEPLVRTVMDMFKGQIIDVREGR